MKKKPWGRGGGGLTALVLLLLLLCCWERRPWIQQLQPQQPSLSSSSSSWVEAFAPNYRPALPFLTSFHPTKRANLPAGKQNSAFSRSRARTTSSTVSRWAFGSNYLDSLGPPSNDSGGGENNNSDNKNLAGAGSSASSNMDGIASFQSGSYLDNLQRNNQDSSRGNSNNYGGAAAASTSSPFSSNTMSSGSYLNALGSSGSVSPWDRQRTSPSNSDNNNNNNSNSRVAPWKQREGPKFLPVPQQSSSPWETDRPSPSESSAPVPSPNEARVDEADTITPTMDEPQTAEETVDNSNDDETFSDVVASNEQEQSTSNIDTNQIDIDEEEDDLDEEEKAALLLDMLDSTRIVYENLAGAYENLVGDMIEGEGIIIEAPAPPPQPSMTSERVITSEIAYTATEQKDMSMDNDDFTTDTYDGSYDEGFDDDDVNEPIYLDSVNDDNGPAQTLEDESDTNSNKDMPARKTPPPVPFFGNLVNEMWEAVAPAPIQRATPEPPAPAPKTAAVPPSFSSKSVSKSKQSAAASDPETVAQPPAQTEPSVTKPAAPSKPAVTAKDSGSGSNDNVKTEKKTISNDKTSTPSRATSASPNIGANVVAASSEDRNVSSFSETEIPPSPSRKLDDETVAAAINEIVSGNNGDERRGEDLPVTGDFAAEFEDNEEVDAEMEALNAMFMSQAIDLAYSYECVRSSYPNPRVGAVWVAEDGTILGEGFSSFRGDAIRTALETAGLEIATLDGEWIDSWPTSSDLRKQISTSTLYVTLEPSMSARGSAFPPITRLIEQIGIPRVVIGSADPVTERTLKGAASLNAAGISVNLGSVMREECDKLIEEYALIANSRLRRMARKHFERFGRPLGFLHCSVVDSDNVEAFARQGNAFGSSFGGKQLSYRDFGSYELAPPPDVVWADGGQVEYYSDDDDDGDIMSVDFDDENYQEILSGTPIMPYYEQVDAVVVTFPRQGNGPPDDDSVAGRLRGLRWLATHGCNLPPGVERVLVLDATDLKDLPLNNGDPNLPPGFDIEAFWRGANRKQTRIILRRAGNESAHAAARAAARAAASAAEAAARAAAAIDSGDAAECAEAALECQKVAQESMEFVKKELSVSTELRRRFEAKGAKVESIEGGEPIDIMKHLGKRNGYRSVVWRAGCWGERGVRAILEGAFQMVSAHLAVPAIGGRFWQLMIAENAVQAACGPQSKVKIFADQEDISMEYCDNLDVDEDCVLTIDGKPVRHVRLDCRVALVDKNRPRKFDVTKTEKINRKILTEEAPWFL